MECSTCLAIVSASDRLYMESQGWQDIFDSNSDLLVEMEEFDDQIVIKEEKMADSSYNGICYEPLPEEQDENVEDEESINDPEDKPADEFASFEESQPVIRRKRGPRKKWLNNMLKNCKSIANTNKEKIDVWKCCFCNTTEFISLPGLKYHVQRAHAKALNDFQVKSEAVSTEVIKKASKRHLKDPGWIKQMVERSKDQCLKIWRCSICNAMTSKTEFGMHIHIVRMHCERKESNIVPNSVVKHEHDLDWINEMTEKSQNEEGFWKCCLCNNITSSKRLGIYFHIMRMHCKSRNESSSVSRPASSFKEVNHEAEEGEKHEKDPEWIKAMVESSNSDSIIGLWTCCICKVVQSSSAVGIQLHIIRMHCKKQNFVPKAAKTEKHERDPEWIKEMIDNSRISDGDFDMWNCCLCLNFTCATRMGIQLHIIRMHCDDQIFIPTQKSSSKDSSNNKSIEDESDKYEKDPKWITEMVEISRCGEENSWTCCICSKVTSNSALGIRFHIMRRHCKSRSNNPPSTDEGVKHERDPEWINEMIAISKTSDGDVWNCSLCQNFTCSSHMGIKLHIIRKHCDNQSFIPLPKSVEILDDESEKHDREPEWIKEMVESSKPDEANLRTCCICNIVKSSSAFGIRLHIIKMHCKKQSFVSEATQRYEKDPEWINTMIESSKSSENPDIWNCCICNTFTCASRLGIQLHIIRIHCISLAGSKTLKKSNSDSSDDEFNRNDLDIDYSNTDMKTKHLRRGKRWNNWVKKMAMKSERKMSNQNGSAWFCTICKAFGSHSYLGMKHHIARMHRTGAIVKMKRFKKTTKTSTKIKNSQTFESNAGASIVSTISQYVGSKYECDICSESYTSKSDLLIHLKKELNIDEEPTSFKSIKVEQPKTFVRSKKELPNLNY